MSCINDDINTKMKLIGGVSERAGISKKAALRAIEKYTGDDPAAHCWNYEVRERGAKVFVLLQSTTEHLRPKFNTPIGKNNA